MARSVQRGRSFKKRDDEADANQDSVTTQERNRGQEGREEVGLIPFFDGWGHKGTDSQEPRDRVAFGRRRGPQRDDSAAQVWARNDALEGMRHE